MIRKQIACFLLFISSAVCGTFPVAYQGRFHPSDVYLQQSFYEIYHSRQIKRAHRPLFSRKTSASILWQLHYKGIDSWSQSPLLYIQSAYLKNQLGFPATTSRFSYEQIREALFENSATGARAAALLIETQKDAPDSPSELGSLAKGLWVQRANTGIKILSAPSHPPWNFLQPGEVLEPSFNSAAANEALELAAKVQRLARPALPDDPSLPILDRLRRSGNDFKALPYKGRPGEWVSLRALNLDIPNFTPYPDSLFLEIKQSYQNRDIEKLSLLLTHAYDAIAGLPYLEASNKTLSYPSLLQLKAESLLFRYPWLLMCAALYGAAFLSGLFRGQTMNLASLSLAVCAYMLHTAILAIRCYILERPPVSNMFETIIYVPWAAMLGGLILRMFSAERWLIVSAALVNALLLILLEVTQLNHQLENVQAVLDSQYWLIVHVLMVVGSYGMFALAGAMAHIYFIMRARSLKETAATQALGKQIVQAMYVGTALLIPGTILGGVWAAESWGRFWDWDPKESWAFISSCIYLVWIHAYRFKHIGFDGIATGAATGFMAISFTWYGVNYILGTGLHSYGFGSGGEIYYYAYLAADSFFLAAVWLLIRRSRIFSSL